MNTIAQISLLEDPHTSLANLKESGWTIELSQSGQEFFRHETTQAAVSIPLWAKEYAQRCANNAREAVQIEIRRAMGME